VPSAAPADPGSIVVPGPSDGLPATPAKGEPLVIAAVVLDRSCRPAAGATVNLWHTDSRGLYRPAGTSQGSVRASQVVPVFLTQRDGAAHGEVTLVLEPL
jgi:protocatechuate 3,4-dioxygenase beta subunit